jgi:hypothetical protein
MLLKSFEYFIQEGNLIFLSKVDQIAFFKGVNLIQNLTLSVCFLIGPWQFVPYLFRKIPNLHFAIGNVYVMLTLLLSAPTLIVSAFGLDSIWKIFYTLILGALWWWSTRKGIFYISNKKWLLHLKWMMYSYILLINIVLFKVILYFQMSIFIPIFIAISSVLILYFIEKMNFHQRILNAFVKIK